MHKQTLIALALLTVLTAGCKHREEAAKKQGADLVGQRIQQPINRARAVTQASDTNLPALLDAGANVYHKPGCKNADPGTMETTTVGQAVARGAKPDPTCFTEN
ncbi:MAG: hypothetical protein JWM80_4053 [Cyanobacteria bacterium RYN_339]|nr:hypothetical protein [Cyanobacteria bacterium RYN_339]